MRKIKMIVKKFFTGKIEQTPPIFSAVKIDGVRAYKLARNNKEVKILFMGRLQYAST